MNIRKLLALLLLPLCGICAAQDNWPSKPLRFIVPWAVGGAADTPVRLLAEHLSASLRQPVVVENRTGAGGNIGTDAVAKAAPDGYTLVLANVSTFATNPYLYRSLPFNPFKDFAPVTLTQTAPLVLAVHPSVPARNLAELNAYVKAQSGKLAFGSSGIGGSDHMSGELYKARVGADIVHIPFKGGVVAQIDLLAGRTQMQFVTIPGALPHLRSGKLRAIAVVSDKRFPLLPDVPTMAEAGMADFNVTNWFGVMVPAGTPPAIIKRLNTELIAALRAPDVTARLTELGLVPKWSTPEEFGAYLKASAATMENLVRLSGASAE